MDEVHNIPVIIKEVNRNISKSITRELSVLVLGLIARPTHHGAKRHHVYQAFNISRIFMFNVPICLNTK